MAASITANTATDTSIARTPLAALLDIGEWRGELSAMR
jgi:hypothetical protein